MPKHTQSRYRGFKTANFEYDNGLKEFIPHSRREWVNSLAITIGFFLLVMLVAYIEGRFGI